MYEIIGIITTLFIFAFLMRGAYLMVEDAQKRYNDRKKQIKAPSPFEQVWSTCDRNGLLFTLTEKVFTIQAHNLFAVTV